MPLADDPRWIDLLNDAGRKEKRIEVETVNEGVQLRQLLYRVRAHMKETKHIYMHTASLVKISIMVKPKDKPAFSFVSRKTTPIPEGDQLEKVYLQLTPDKFANILDREGYKVSEEPEL